MPTKKPRLAIALHDEDYELVSRLAVLTGQSRAAFVSGLVSSIREPLARTVALIEAAKAAPASLRDTLRHAAELAEVDLMKAMDGGSTALRELVELARAGRPSPPPPPHTNRGVRYLRPPLCHLCGRADCPGAAGGACRFDSDPEGPDCA